MTVRIETIDAYNPDFRILEQAARLITKGEVLVCPTDTGYAFSANGLDPKAVARVFNLKGRSYSNPIHVAVSSIEEAGKYAHINEAARHLASRFLPGALTLVLPKKETIPAMLVAGRDTIGIRVPDNRAILSLAEMTALPLSAWVITREKPFRFATIINSLSCGMALCFLGYGALRQPERPRGLVPLFWGALCFLIAVVISLLKGGVIQRAFKRLRERTPSACKSAH